MAAKLEYVTRPLRWGFWGGGRESGSHGKKKESTVNCETARIFLTEPYQQKSKKREKDE